MSKEIQLDSGSGIVNNLKNNTSLGNIQDTLRDNKITDDEIMNLCIKQDGSFDNEKFQALQKFIWFLEKRSQIIIEDTRDNIQFFQRQMDQMRLYPEARAYITSIQSKIKNSEKSKDRWVKDEMRGFNVKLNEISTIGLTPLVIKLKTQYLETISGINTEYDNAPSAIGSQDSEYIMTLQSLSNDIINSMETKDAFIYLVGLHKKIDRNNWQSDHVQNSYEMVASNLNRSVLEKIKADPKSTNENFYEFAQLVTDRWNYNIDSRLQDPALAQEALGYVLLEKDDAILKDKISLDDEKVVRNTFSRFDNSLSSLTGNDRDLNENILHLMGISSETQQEIKNQNPFAYTKLSYKAQMALSVFARINEDFNGVFPLEYKELAEANVKMEKVVKKMYPNNPTAISSTLPTGEEMENGKVSSNMDINIINSVLDMLLVKNQYEQWDYDNFGSCRASVEKQSHEIGKVTTDALAKKQGDAQEALQESFEDATTSWAWLQKDFDLSGIDEDIYDLYQEINGTGWFDVSDKNWSRAAFGWKMTVVIGAAVAATLLTGGLAAVVAGGSLAAGWAAIAASAGTAAIAGAAGGMAGALAARGVYTQGFDSYWEVAADVAISGTLGAAGWAILKGVSTIAWEWLKRSTILAGTGLAAGAVEMGAEHGRQKYFESRGEVITSDFEAMIKTAGPLMAICAVVGLGDEIMKWAKYAGKFAKYSKGVHVKSAFRRLRMEGFTDEIMQEVNNLKKRVKVWEIEYDVSFKSKTGGGYDFEVRRASDDGWGELISNWGIKRKVFKEFEKKNRKKLETLAKGTKDNLNKESSAGRGTANDPEPESSAGRGTANELFKIQENKTLDSVGIDNTIDVKNMKKWSTIEVYEKNQKDGIIIVRDTKWDFYKKSIINGKIEEGSPIRFQPGELNLEIQTGKYVALTEMEVDFFSPLEKARVAKISEEKLSVRGKELEETLSKALDIRKDKTMKFKIDNNDITISKGLDGKINITGAWDITMETLCKNQYDVLKSTLNSSARKQWFKKALLGPLSEIPQSEIRILKNMKPLFREGNILVNKKFLATEAGLFGVSLIIESFSEDGINGSMDVVNNLLYTLPPYVIWDLWGMVNEDEKDNNIPTTE